MEAQVVEAPPEISDLTEVQWRMVSLAVSNMNFKGEVWKDLAAIQSFLERIVPEESPAQTRPPARGKARKTRAKSGSRRR